MQLRKRWPRGRGSSKRLLFCALLAGLLCAPAMAESYYEFNGPYCFGTGGACFGDPVDVVTGAFLIRKDLETIPGRVPIRIGWQFNSQDNTDGPLGKGTSLSYDYFIAQSQVSDYSYELSAPGNLHFAFDLTPNGNGDYIDSRDPELLGATLHFTGTGLACTLRWKNGSKFTFDQYGQLIKVADRRGNYLTIGRDNSIPRTGFATTVYQQNILRRVIFAYSGGKLSTIQVKFVRDPSPLNHTWTFGYDGQGRLSTVTDPMNGVTHYAWTSYVRSPDNVTLPLVDTVTNPRGYVEVDNDYDPLGTGRVVKQTYADGRFLTAAYSNPILQDGNTTVTDPNGNVTTWAHTWVLLSRAG
jgi:YD repeat-containing protein